MLKNKKRITLIVVSIIVAAIALLLLTHKVALLGQEVLLEKGQSVLILGTPLEVQLTGFVDPCVQPDIDCVQGGTSYPEYEYRLWGLPAPKAEGLVGKEVSILPDGYTVDEVSSGSNWVRMKVSLE